MALARTQINAQGEVSAPVEVCERLGVGPGSILEWDMESDKIVVRRGKYTCEDMHRVLFPDGPPKPISVEELDEAIGEYLKKKHADR